MRTDEVHPSGIHFARSPVKLLEAPMAMWLATHTIAHTRILPCSRLAVPRHTVSHSLGKGDPISIYAPHPLMVLS